MNNLNQPIIITKPAKPLKLILISACVLIIVWTSWSAIKMIGVAKNLDQLEKTNGQNSAIQSVMPASYTPEQQLAIEGQGNYALGAARPLVTIVEFGDFACSYCQASYSVIRELSLEYPDDLKIVWRDRPAFDYSLNLAQAAYCAGEQDKFWPMHDKLFMHQSSALGSSAQDIVTLAQQIGVNTTAFSQCLVASRYLEQIKANYLAAEALEVTGTPTWFVNGQKIEGHLSKSDWEVLLNKLMN